MSAPTSPADLVILGGGSGGYAAAFRAAELGLNVVLIEKDKVGGTCLHRGCIPTKALLHAGEVADLAREGEQFGVKTSLAGIDMDGVNTYKDGVVSKLYKGLQGLVKARKITYVEGEGRLTSPTTVEVNGQTYEGKHILLATGSYARSLPGLEIDGTKVITSDHALNLDRVPASAIVLGGGVIGCEFASAWKSFGVDVTIVEALPHLVPLEDEASSKLLERAFRRRKIGFELGSRFSGVQNTENGVKVSLENGKEIEAELLLVAVGRGPVSQGLGYEEAGVADGPRLRPRRRVLPHQRADHLRRRRPDPDAAAGPRRLRRGHPRRRAARRARARPDRLRRRPADHLLRPRGRLGRAHRGPGQGEVRRGHDPHLRPRRQRQEPDPEDRPARSS